MLIEVCSVSDIDKEECRLVEVPGRAPVAVFLVGDRLYATDDTCTHGDASLCDGFLDGEEVECPFHSGRFNVTTGAATQFPATDPLRTYPVLVQGDVVYVDVAEK